MAFMLEAEACKPPTSGRTALNRLKTSRADVMVSAGGLASDERARRRGSNEALARETDRELLVGGKKGDGGIGGYRKLAAAG